MVARAAIAVTHLETIEAEGATLRERALADARAALGATQVLGSRPPGGAPVAPRIVSPVPPPPAVTAKPSSPPPAPERPAPRDDFETIHDVEVSFASIAPPASTQIRAVAPYAGAPHPSVRPTGRPTPDRVQAVRPVPSSPPASPLSDPSIRIPIDEDEG
jgi:hypothetical protein